MRNTISTKFVQSVRKVVVGAAVVLSVWGTTLMTTTPVCAARNKGKAKVAASKGKAKGKKGKKVSSPNGFSQPTPPVPQPPVQTATPTASQPTASQVAAPPTSSAPQTVTMTVIDPVTGAPQTVTIPQPTSNDLPTVTQSAAQPTASQVAAPPTQQSNTQPTVVQPPPSQSNSDPSAEEKQLLVLAWLEGFNYLLLGQYHRPGLWNAPGFVEGARDQLKWWDNWFIPVAKMDAGAALTTLQWNLYFIAYYAPYTKLSVVYQLNSASAGDEFADWLRMAQSNYLLGSYVGAQLNLVKAYQLSPGFGDILRDNLYRPIFGDSMITVREAVSVLRDPNEFLAVMVMMKTDWELQRQQLASQQQNQVAYGSGNQAMDFNTRIAQQIYEQSGLGEALARERAEAPMKDYINWRYLNDPAFRMQVDRGIMQNLYEQLSPEAQVRYRMTTLGLQASGIPSGLLGDLSNFNTIFAPNADEINRRVEFTRTGAAASQGEVAARQVLNPMQRDFYNQLAQQANLDQLRQVFGDQMQLKDSLKEVYFESDPSLPSGY